MNSCYNCYETKVISIKFLLHIIEQNSYQFSKLQLMHLGSAFIIYSVGQLQAPVLSDSHYYGIGVYVQMYAISCYCGTYCVQTGLG